MGGYLDVFSKKPNVLCTSEEGSKDYFKYGASIVQGWRRSQEDRFQCVMNFYKDLNFFAVYDGHGGDEVVIYVKERLHEELASFLEMYEDDPELALQLSFLSCDNSIKDASEDEIDEISQLRGREFEVPDRKAICPAFKEIFDPGVAGTSTDVLAQQDEFRAEVSSAVLKFLAADKLEPEESEEDDEDYNVENDMNDVELDESDGEENNGEISDADDDDDSNGADNVPSEKNEDNGEETDSNEDSSKNENEKFGFNCGSTASVVLLRKEFIYIANVGDSKCIASIGGKAVDLSLDHVPTDEEEYKRIKEAGSRVHEGRIDGGLNLSRAFGDFSFKDRTNLSAVEQAVICDPFVKTIKITKDTEFVVIASDGIWNSMSSQEVVDFIKIRLQSKDSTLASICNELFYFILAPNTDGDGTGCDNMTCVIIQLNTSSEPWFECDPYASEADLEH